MIDEPLGTDGPETEDGIPGSSPAFGCKHNRGKTNRQPTDDGKHQHGITRYAPYRAAARSNCRLHACWSTALEERQEFRLRPSSTRRFLGGTLLASHANPMRLVCVVGTRPEAVKLAPLVRELRNHPHIHTDVINSGQHGDAPPKLLEELGVQTDEDLGTVTSASLSEMAGWLGRKLRDSRATLQQDWNRVDSRLWWQGHRGCVRSSEWHRKGARASLHHRILRVGDARSARRAVVRVAASGCRRRLQGVCNRAGCNAGPKALRGAGTSNADFTSVTVTGFARRWLSRSTGVHASVEYQRFLNSYQRIGLGGRLFVEFELASRMNALVSPVGRAASFARRANRRGYRRRG